MRMYSARLAWFDAFHSQGGSGMWRGLEAARLGLPAQRRGLDDGRFVHMVLAGKVQSGIARLPKALQSFGHYLYAPEVDTATSNHWEEVAEALLTGLVLRRVQLSSAKQIILPWVARGVLYRYRRMVQGGMGQNPDPLESPRQFRAWLFDRYGVRLDSRNWTREWGAVIEALFTALDDLDRRALAPVTQVLAHERDGRRAEAGSGRGLGAPRSPQDQDDQHSQKHRRAAPGPEPQPTLGR